MPARRELTMRQRQMLRLAREGVSEREIGRTLGVARSTVQDNLKRAEAAGLVWPLGSEKRTRFSSSASSPAAG
jgi:IS30 family transposase